jgi:hypothetical protein
MAQPGHSFIYCVGPAVPAGPTKAKVTELIGKGVVRAHVRRMPGDAIEHYVVKRFEEPKPKGEPAPDEATETIYEALERAAARRRRCYSDTELARIAGLATRNQAAWRFKKLIEAKRIRSRVVPGPDGRQWRIVTIVASGRSTCAPTKPEATK